MATQLNAAYDYIILGRGTAGYVLANRLSEDANTTVLVIEAGSYRLDDLKINIPGLMAALYVRPAQVRLVLFYRASETLKWSNYRPPPR